MATAQDCVTPFRGEGVRVVQLDECGVAVPGAPTWEGCGFVSLEISPEIEEGDDIEQKKANGQPCIFVPGCRSLKYYNVSLELCGFNATLLSILQENSFLTLDADGNTIGAGITDKSECDRRVALEVFSELPHDECDADSVKQCVRFFLPRVGSFQQDSDVTIQDGEVINITLSGQTYSPGEHDDPYGLLIDPIPEGTHFLWHCTPCLEFEDCLSGVFA